MITPAKADEICLSGRARKGGVKGSRHGGVTKLHLGDMSPAMWTESCDATISATC